LTASRRRASVRFVGRAGRSLEIDERQWAALGELAERLGVERGLLVRQAIHAFLQFHGALPPPATTGRHARTQRVLEAARDLEAGLEVGLAGPGYLPTGPALTLLGPKGPLATVRGERFLIGRGRHCDLVIDSAKVSREHAVIQREADGWWIEDLGSSNGTWMGKAKVERRRIADGDEYSICAEKLRCVLSPSP
jgi:hypothetical protein